MSRRIRVLALAALPLAAGCAGPPPLPAPVGAARCTVPGVGTADAPWRRVRAIGFTFCVPPHWRPDGPAPRGADALTWTGDNGSITWGATSQPVLEGDIIVAVPVRSGMRVDPGSPGFPSPCTTPITFQYDVDGLIIATSQHRCQGTWLSTASIGESFPPLRGEARSSATAELQMEVYRTIRLAPPTR